MSTEDEARAELIAAAKRLKKYHDDGFIRSEFRGDMNTVLDSILLAEASRKVEVTETELNVLAQRFYEASGLVLMGTDKPKIIAGLRRVFELLGGEQ